jgi:hypothetical protein
MSNPTRRIIRRLDILRLVNTKPRKTAAALREVEEECLDGWVMFPDHENPGERARYVKVEDILALIRERR